MAKAYKGDYVEYNINRINKLIYNDLPLDELFDDLESTYNSALNKLLVKGEVAEHIPFLRDEYYITNLGRIINAKRIRELTVTLVRDEYLGFTANARRWKIEPIMLDCGFTYNMDTILDYYKSIDYPFAKLKC